MNELLRRLPDTATVRDRCRAMAMLDAILSPNWDGRHYSFNSHWAEDEEMASMRDGSGDDWFMVFSPSGVYARGFDHSGPNAPHLLDAVPKVFRSSVEEPAFASHDGSRIATICLWREPGDAAWQVAATEEGGGEGLFELLVSGTPEAYREWAEEYYETEVDLAAVRHIFALRPLTPAVVAAIDPEAELADLEEDITEIGYPT